MTRRPASSGLDLHRLVHLAARNWLSENGQITEWASKAVTQLVEIFPNDKHKSRSVWRAYMPHASYALLSTDVGQNRENRIKLLGKVGVCLLNNRRFNKAEGHLVQVIEKGRRC